MDKVKSLALAAIGSEELAAQISKMTEYAFYGTRTDPLAPLIDEMKELDGITVGDLAALVPSGRALQEARETRAKDAIFQQ